MRPRSSPAASGRERDRDDASHRVLLVEDDSEDAHLVHRLMRPVADAFSLDHSTRMQDAAGRADRYDAVLLDLNLPDSPLRDTLDRISELADRSAVVVLTGSAEEDLGIEAVRRGAQDYLVKGRVGSGALARSLRFAIERTARDAPAATDTALSPPCTVDHEPNLRIVGTSQAIRQATAEAVRVAAFDTGVLLVGETGTGKELFASTIHDRSPRAAAPFVAVNCAALSETLLESQLFGHRRGAFTGATHDQKGFFEAAAGGTVFLDEIGDMPESVQTRLLRVLEAREVVRIGESTPRRLDVRVIAATQHDLAARVAERSFRADLYYRLCVTTVRLPALRERHGDVAVLARHFLATLRQERGQGPRRLSPGAIARLGRHDWPGNVRELRNVIEAAFVHARAEQIGSVDLPLNSEEALPTSWARTRPDARAILRALEEAGGNRSAAARALGISRATLYRRMSELTEPAD